MIKYQLIKQGKLKEEYRNKIMSIGEWVVLINKLHPLKIDYKEFVDKTDEDMVNFLENVINCKFRKLEYKAIKINKEYVVKRKNKHYLLGYEKTYFHPNEITRFIHRERKNHTKYEILE